MISDRIQDELPTLRNIAARLLFRALCDYVHFKKWSNGRRPKNKIDRHNKEAFESANDWLFIPPPQINEGDSEVDKELKSLDQLMSFETACYVLKWDPDWIRSQIPKLTAADLRKVGKKNGFL